MGAIFRREVRTYFTSPVAYIFITAFYLYTGMYFVNYNISSGTADTAYMFSSAFVIMMVLIPLLTMRLFTEEKKQRTDQCLLTAPVSLSGIVYGKFFAALGIFICGILIYVPYVIVLYTISGKIEWATVGGTMFALLLLGAAFISIGIFVSSLTENQVVAAIVTFVINLFFYMIDMIAGNFQNTVIKTAMTSIGFYTRYNEFTTGIFNVSGIVFFLSIIFIFNFLTIRVLEKRRWSE